VDIGFIGLGKLGLPVAVAIAQRGHRVVGFDADRDKIERYRAGKTDLYEPGLDDQMGEMLDLGRMMFAESVDAVVRPSRLIFIAVQTPHAADLDGTQPLFSTRRWDGGRDFDYQHLVRATQAVRSAIRGLPDSRSRLVVVMSTVLPGIMRQRVLPELNAVLSGDDTPADLLYSPSFIAMGSTIADFLNPEFSLIGTADGHQTRGTALLTDFYRSIHSAPVHAMTWEEAEATKVFYNTFISMKIVFANAVMQMCHELSPMADSDVVLGTLRQATDRIVSPKYLAGGMGDGGACHPRDNLALSFLSNRLGLTYDLFGDVMRIREAQAEWLAQLMSREALPMVILGKTYKANTRLTDGSASLLIANVLRQRGHEVIFHDPATDPDIPRHRAVFLIGTTWAQFKRFPFPHGSVVIDPWGMLDGEPDGCTLVRVGRASMRPSRPSG
jgi:UDPglucose 6-dehydrogenase